MGIGGGILGWEDEYGVLESYPSDSAMADVGFASCDHVFDWEVVGDDNLLDSSSHADSGSDQFPHPPTRTCRQLVGRGG